MSDILARPDIQDLRTRFNSQFSARWLKGGDVLAGSFEDTTSSILAGVAFLLQGVVVKTIESHINLEKMCCDDIYRFAERRKIFPKKAGFSRGFIKIKGNVAALIPSNISFDVGSSSFILDPVYLANPFVIAANGEAILRIKSVKSGISENQKALIGSLTSSVNGINDDFIVVSDGLTGASDEETCEQLRKRLIKMRSNKSSVANNDWYIEKVMSFPGVTRVCIDSCVTCCDDSITIYPFMDGIYLDGIPPAAACEQVAAYLWGVPSGHGKGIAPYGQNGCVRPARKSVFNIQVYGISVQNYEVITKVRRAIEAYLLAKACPSDLICLSVLRGFISSIIGGCVTDIKFTSLNNSVIDDINITPDCGYFLSLGELIV